MQVLTWIWAWKIDSKDWKKTQRKPEAMQKKPVTDPWDERYIYLHLPWKSAKCRYCKYIPWILRVYFFSVFLNETAWNVAAIFFFVASSVAKGVVPLTPGRCYFDHFWNPRSAFKPFALKLQSSMELSLCRVRVTTLPGVLDVSGHCSHQSDATRNLQDVRPREGAAFDIRPSCWLNGVDFSSAWGGGLVLNPLKFMHCPNYCVYDLHI